ncbi:hypothetical protein QX776_12830 [Alteromonadaceae bacterium BrNp21-10]|nr:hypothetical protein [Alteromonadaceae bacterium BrNp21-10]
MTEKSNIYHKISERRFGHDIFYRLMVALNVASWSIFIAAMAVFHLARPEMETGVSRYLNIEIRTDWDHSLLSLLFMLLVSCVGLTLAMLIIRSRRARRKTDSMWMNMFILIATAGASLLVMLMRFEWLQIA